mmetsp:Transcript_59350/g.173580  ORF Transcript_59350/g.173580 Transcript_59350/m.173580 type:complete len:313 (-) Transcript_59350:653-1591(-)
MPNANRYRTRSIARARLPIRTLLAPLLPEVALTDACKACRCMPQLVNKDLVCWNTSGLCKPTRRPSSRAYVLGVCVETGQSFPPSYTTGLLCRRIKGLEGAEQTRAVSLVEELKEHGLAGVRFIRNVRGERHHVPALIRIAPHDHTPQCVHLSLRGEHLWRLTELHRVKGHRPCSVVGVVHRFEQCILVQVQGPTTISAIRQPSQAHQHCIVAPSLPATGDMCKDVEVVLDGLRVGSLHREVVNGARLHDGAGEQTRAPRRHYMSGNHGCARALAKNRHATRVTTERSDVPLHPTQCLTRVLDPKISLTTIE